jgi:hypothetical protein
MEGRRMSRKIDDLQSWFRPKVREFTRTAKEGQGLVLLVTRTFVDEYTQKLLYAVGRRTLLPQEVRWLKNEGVYPASEKRTVTNAENARDTAHGLGLAFDCIPYIPNTRKLWWDCPDEEWARLYKVAEACGLDALGDPWGEYLPWDKGHFQEPGWTVYKGKSY